MKESLIKFETAVLAKEVGFDVKCFSGECLYFYTNPKSKMFGIDEEGRYYDIKNISKKLYERGEEATLNDENVYLALTQSLLQKWLREVHNVEISVLRYTYSGGVYQGRKYMYGIDQYDPEYNFEIEENSNHWILNERKSVGYKFNTYEEALEEALKESLKLIKNE